MSTTEVRFGTLLGVEHTIAPIVLLVGDSVIFPINAEHPEFVPADILGVAPAGWNGRPLMSGDHPSDETGMLSANIPIVLEGQQFGHLFGARFEDNKLQGDVWIDPARAALVPDGLAILQRIKDGDPVEISVGAFVVVERTAGTTPRGQDYGSIWREIVPDHIALLREGLIGACSIEMGCGTPRAACQHHVVDAAAGMRVMTSAEVSIYVADVQNKSTLRAAARATAAEASATEAEATTEARVDIAPELKTKLVAFFGSEAALTTAQGMSDVELNELLLEALRRSEPQVRYIASVVQDDKTVVYLIDPDPGGPAPLKPYQRSYALGADGTVTINDDRKPVRRREEWVPVAGYRSAEETARAEAAARGGCGCGGNHSASGAGGVTIMKERITALIANPRSPFEEADRAYLETLTEDRIKAAEDKAAETAASTTAAATTDADADPNVVTVSKDELSSLRAMAAEREKTRAAQKKVLVGKLKAAQKTYTEARLLTMELEALQDIASLLDIDAPAATDFVALERETTEPVAAVEPPKPWSLASAKRRGATN